MGICSGGGLVGDRDWGTVSVDSVVERLRSPSLGLVDRELGAGEAARTGGLSREGRTVC